VAPVTDPGANTEGRPSVDLPVPRRALAIGAHPDDIEFGCGATLAKWAAAGTEICHLVLTDGSRGTWDPSADPAALVTVREREQRAAARLLGGGEVEFLRYPDGELEAGLPQRREVCRVIRTVRPDVVLGHDPWRRYRLHPDHRHAGFLVADAIVAARDPHFFPDLGLPPHRPSALLLFEADEPNHVEGVAGFAETKLRALLAHRSQFRSTMRVEDEHDEGQLAAFRARVLARLAEHGRLAGLDEGEAFRLISEL
jgi:LmbE family N-acetylglucosaminyl deacetylase